MTRKTLVTALGFGVSLTLGRASDEDVHFVTLSPRQISQTLIFLVLLVALLPSGTAEAASPCPPGWRFNAGAYNCLSPQSSPSRPIRCDGPCMRCGSSRAAQAGETGGPAGGCPSSFCGPTHVCTWCAISLACMDQGKAIEKLKGTPPCARKGSNYRYDPQYGCMKTISKKAPVTSGGAGGE